MLKISLETSPKRRMSDAEENPLQETEEYGEIEMEEGEEEEEKYPDDEGLENMQQELKEDNTLAWRGSQEEGEAEGEEAEGKEEGEEFGKEEAAGAQEETTVKPQEITKSMISLERLTPTDSQSVLSGTLPKTYSGRESKHSLQSELLETLELPRSMASQLEFLDLDLTTSAEQQLSSPEKQPSGELAERTDQRPQDELGQERRHLEPERGDLEPEKREGRKEKRVLYVNEKKEKEFQPKASIPKVSLVSTATEDILFQKDDGANVYPLAMTWSFGWNSSLPVYYIQDENQRVLLYASAHTAVIYNVFKNNQHHLQGHPNVISCLCISEDRRWVATADKGPDCLIIIWDCFTGIPVHTIFDSCPEGDGIRAIAITHDAKYLATISDAEIQKVCIWRWTLAVETPACTLNLPKEYGFQSYLTFNPTNNKELVSNSKTQAIYYMWYEEGDILVHSAPLLTEKTFNKLVGKFSQSVFHLNLTQILSATMEGKLVVWDIYRPPLSASTSLGFPHIIPCKLVHLQKEGITVLTTVDSYIVTGDIRGNIKFYDHTLSIVNWYSHFKLSSIRSLSFSKTLATPPTENTNYPPDCTLKGDRFIVRNFIIGTSDASVYHLTADGTKLEKLFVEPKDAICAISCHPYQPLIAIGSFCGVIKVWDYEQKKYLFSRIFEKGLGVQSLTYNPEGALLGAGFTEGTVYILDAMSLESEIPEPFKYSRTSVTHVSFSHDSQYMATADVSFTVAVYVVRVKNGRRVWEYLARLRSHRKSIRSVLFGVHLDSNEPRLLSLGRDRLLIEYNLLKSYKDHLEVLDIQRTDQGSYPTCMVWYPPLTKELFLLICNSGYKVKLFNSTTKMCSPDRWCVRPRSRRCNSNTFGNALEAAVSLGGEDLTPFYGLVSGGREGKFYRELEDYFYYSQLRSQGIDTMETRKVSEHICLSELPFVMRAIGFYPSEEKIEDMFNEIRFSEYVDTGKLIDKINLPDFFKVYLNHRPPFGNTMSGIQRSFDILGFTNSKGKKAIRREDFLKLLQTKGEHMTEEEMSDCFATLFGLNPEGWKSEPAASSVKGSEICFEEELPDEITAEIFTTQILGLTISQDSGQDPTVSEVERSA
ncbi:cilia- and flagella-associated protein 251 [Monodon monoceros]|uniref:cilia- and flagella-associated protein 251 n=1 Tax=Monodon monoceros TaxID=40151 RepID=UPI0010F5B04A|nr:cilia- and flagella-associated protein 251 [Monodon monoceros]